MRKFFINDKILRRQGPQMPIVEALPEPSQARKWIAVTYYISYMGYLSRSYPLRFTSQTIAEQTWLVAELLSNLAPASIMRWCISIRVNNQFMSYFRRTFRSKLWRGTLLLLGAVLITDFIKSLWSGSNRHQNSSVSIPTPTPSVYIASIFWNSAYILHTSWNSAILDLAEKLGATNIYISIYESGSWDESKQRLRQPHDVLITRGIRHRIILDETSHEDDIARPPAAEGWIKPPRGKTELRRIPYFSRLRNKTLEPLAELAANGTTLDKVLFLNDVAFTVIAPRLYYQETLNCGRQIRDVWTLLETNNGNYAAVCALDFSKPPNFYDTFALRDIEGHEHLMMTYSYFRSHESRSAMVSHRPVPVQSCWNGMGKPYHLHACETPCMRLHVAFPA